MNQPTKDSIMRKLQAMTAGPTPLMHYVRCEHDQISVHVQPWGSPVYLTWDQALTFTRDLPIEVPAERKSAASETRHYKKRRSA